MKYWVFILDLLMFFVLMIDIAHNNVHLIAILLVINM